MAVQQALSRTWLETLKTGFVVTGLICEFQLFFPVIFSLKSLQIFSPNSQYSDYKENIIPTSSADLMNDRSPLKSIPLPPEFEDEIIPEKPFHLFDANDIEFEPKKDAKSFLTNLFGPKQSTTGEKFSENNISGVNDNSFEDSMDETTCYGGIVGKDAVKELTNQITAKMDGQDTRTKRSSTERQPFGDISISDGIDKENDSRNPSKVFQDPEVTTNQTLVMEETKCLGSVLNKSGSAAHIRNFTFHENENLSPANQTLKMEEMAFVGGFMNKALTKEPESKRLSDETTKVFQSLDMDETKCQGGILNKTNFTAEFGQLNLSRTQQGIDMEETKCLTGLINRTVNKESGTLHERKPNESFKMENPDHSDETKVYQSGQDMEETKCVTGLINKTVTNEHTDRTISETTIKEEESLRVGIERHDSPIVTKDIGKKSGNEVQANTLTKNDMTLNDPTAMDETKCNGNTVNKSSSTLAFQGQAQFDLKPNQTLSIEETKFVGGITNKSLTNDLNITQANMTKVYQNEMEETKCHGGILDRTNATSEVKVSNKTIEIQETKCLGGIMSKTSTEELGIKPHSDLTKVYQNFDMEETKCQGGVLNQTNVAHELKMANKTDEFEEAASSQENPVCKAQLNDNNEATDSGEITFNFKSGLSNLKDNKENNGNKTFGNQSVLMEETKCIGGLLNKRSATDRLERDCVKAVSGFETTLNHTMLMEETKCLGGFKGNETREIFSKAKDDRTVNLTSAMEITSCVDSHNNEIGVGIENSDKQSSIETMDTSEAALGTRKLSERTVEMDIGNVENESPVCKFDEVTNESENARNVLDKETTVGMVDNDKSKLFKQGLETMDEDDEVGLKRDSGETDSNFSDEVTRETTQSLARLQKLRDKLILSKKKTPTHFKRPAEPKTDISHGYTGGPSLHPEEMRSPAHKKKKLFDYPIADISKAGDRTLSASDIGM